MVVATAAGGTGPPVAGNAYVVKGGSGSPAYVCCWCPTARIPPPLNTKFQNAPWSNAPSARTSSTVYMKGLAEYVEITTNTGIPWLWRRIVVSSKGVAAALNALQPIQYAVDATANGDLTGYLRLSNDMSTSVRTQFFNYLFKGAQAIDWYDPLIAPVDNSLYHVHYDRTITIQSGNEEGVYRRMKFYHKFNKNFRYSDDETGTDVTFSPWATRSDNGSLLGDVFIVDMIFPRGGATASDALGFNPQSVLYWHEGSNGLNG